MIPVNDAILTALTSMAATALIVVWACRGYWRSKVLDAYQDGHTAGIATQIGRQQRALRMRSPGALRALEAHRERARPPRDGEPATDVILADVTTARHARPGPGTPAVIPFPEGLPPGLREYATRVLAAAAPAQSDAARAVRGQESVHRIIATTRGRDGVPR